MNHSNIAYEHLDIVQTAIAASPFYLENGHLQIFYEIV